MCMNVLPVCTCIWMSTMWIPQTREARARHQISWNRRYRCLWATMYALGTETRSYARATCILKHWDISPALTWSSKNLLQLISRRGIPFSYSGMAEHLTSNSGWVKVISLSTGTCGTGEDFIAQSTLHSCRSQRMVSLASQAGEISSYQDGCTQSWRWKCSAYFNNFACLQLAESHPLVTSGNNAWCFW